MRGRKWIYSMPISETYNLDVMEYLKGVESGAFDLAICDPPYNIVSQQKRGIGSRIDKTGKMNDWNGKVPDSAFFNEIFRISKNQIIWGANNFTLPPTEYFCIWNKHQTVPNFASAEYAWVSPGLKQPALVFEMGIHAHNSSINRIHPTEKPVALYKWLLQNYARPGDKIFDPMMGSQSSRIAAWDMGFDYVGCERDADYFKDGEARFKKHVANKTTLFAPEQMYNFEQTKLEL